ncbi:helix-turn-helix of DDE superfamily endonuclease domain-containing protein [Ditylenchus destructor]|nr:helix-turn-helix of DDE superfamily endonuclease domain-containing protein [Ditylenchus destructor]
MNLDVKVQSFSEKNGRIYGFAAFSKGVQTSDKPARRIDGHRIPQTVPNWEGHCSDTIRADIEFTAERGRKTPAEVQVLCTLDYMRSPGFQYLIASNFGISQQTVSKHVQRVTKALAEKAHEFIRFPTSQATVLTELTPQQIDNGMYVSAHST